jgi:phage shock protein C
METPKKLYRSRKNKVLAGVCGGIAEYFNQDPTIIRILWVILGLGMGVGILAYVIAWVLIPINPTE